MGIFSSIKDAVFGKDDPEPKTAGRTSAQTSGNKPIMPPAAKNPATPVTVAPTTTPSRSAETSIINVENSLDSMPGADRLNWRTSIIDLMKLINVDPSFENRKALADEMGRTDYSGSAEDNIWLHRKTMQELGRNGGKVPAEFLD